ncbi:MAG: GNAT family N-acetyltransferase [Gemmatimonadetes bacterium]|jgi:uncharacterized protein|nr:GNAT family N-acetyltransferase [Gemmatimonadota bacterium]
MDILFYHDMSAFQRRAFPVLKSQCAVNSLKLGILDYYSQDGNESNDHMFAVGIKHDDVVAVFMQAQSLYFFAQEAHFDESIHCAIEEFLRRDIAIPKVMGVGDTALRFAEAWKKRTQTDFRFAGKDYLHELRHIGDTQPTRGTLQRATLEDMPELKPLFSTYYREDSGIAKTDEELEQCITEQLAEDEIYFWDDNGIKCMVTAILPFDSGVELTHVFTRPEDRKRGYATACITEVCRTLFQRYASIVLFVDQKKIAANSLYTKIGFQFVDEMNSYTLSGAAEF